MIVYCKEYHDYITDKLSNIKVSVMKADRVSSFTSARRLAYGGGHGLFLETVL